MAALISYYFFLYKDPKEGRKKLRS